MTVRDTTAPVLTVPADVTAEATNRRGRSSRSQPRRLMRFDPDDHVFAESGTTFALGTTTVTVTATGRGRQHDAEDLPVTVMDTTAPVLDHAGGHHRRGDESGGGDRHVRSHGDRCGSTPTITYSQNPGHDVRARHDDVTVTARDAAGNTTMKTFR